MDRCPDYSYNHIGPADETCMTCIHQKAVSQMDGNVDIECGLHPNEQEATK